MAAGGSRLLKKSAMPQLPLGERRLRFLLVFFVLLIGAVVVRLFVLQVLSHDFYVAMAERQQGLVAAFDPQRGGIYLRDEKAKDGLFPAAVNRPMTTVYANPKEITDARATAKTLAPLLAMDETELLGKLDKPEDPYEVLKRRASDDEADAVRALKLDGIHFSTENYRFYPEGLDLSQVTGFIGENQEGTARVGRYGLERRWQEQLAGTSGYLEASQDPLGRLMGSVERSYKPAEDGADIVLTLDRAVQHVACEKLREAVVKYEADGGSVVILDPQTGAVIAMCNDPSYDANDFAATGDISRFNNPAIFSAYEPGSVFKPVTMAAAIDAGKVSPDSTYFDDGTVVIAPHTIHNSDNKGHGLVTMTQILEQSLNTGTVYVQRTMGREMFRDYVRKFGFGEKTGLDTAGEVAGDVSNLDKRGEIYAATGAFGQGITATPLQMASAYVALANGGRLMRPYLVDQVKRGDSVIRTEPVFVSQVVSKRAAALVSAMLVNVVENGHGKRAGVPGYWVAGKTGTAQVSGVGGYEKDAFIGSFVGFAPANAPKFVMAVKIIKPKNVEWAESSAAPLFGDIASYLLKYYQVPPERPLKGR
jgi:cell division protein FtsI/penicillin-binding protein 2